MPATVKKITEKFTAPALGEIFYLPNAKLPSEQLVIHPWDKPDYTTDQQQAQMLMLALAKMDAEEKTPIFSLKEQTQQSFCIAQKWTQITQQQQRGSVLNMTDLERTKLRESQFKAQQAMISTLTK